MSNNTPMSDEKLISKFLVKLIDETKLNNIVWTEDGTNTERGGKFTSKLDKDTLIWLYADSYIITIIIRESEFKTGSEFKTYYLENYSEQTRINFKRLCLLANSKSNIQVEYNKINQFILNFISAENPISANVK